MASELKVNKISPESGLTLTLGDSGDTINFGSGVLPNFENLTVTGDLTVDTNSLKVDSTNNFVGIGTASPSVALDVVGAITATGNITGTLATASQPNITSVGTLSSLSVSGNITGTLATAAQPNITSLGTLTGLTTTGNINLGDNDKINLGATPTLELYSDGTNSWIKESGTGGLYIGGTNLNIMDSTFAESIITGTTNGAVTLFYDNNAKLATTSTGIDVTGTAVTDGLTVNSGTTDVATRFESTDDTAGVALSDQNGSILLLTRDTGDFSVNVGGSGSSSGSGSSEAMRIDSSGNVIATSGSLNLVGTNTQIYASGNGNDIQFKFNGSLKAAINNGGIISAGDGSNATPGFRFTNESNTGMYRPSSLVLAFVNGGSEKMRIQNNGRIGMGTTSPSGPLHVNSSDNTIAYFTSTDPNANIRFSDSNSSAVGSTGIGAKGNDITIISGGSDTITINSSGHILPVTTNTQDLGSSSLVWRNIYTSDFHMSNEGLDKGNDIDGTKGSWTFQEGENDLFLINNKNGKKYKFNLTEVA